MDELGICPAAVKRYRRERGLTQQELADRIGVSNKSVPGGERSYPMSLPCSSGPGTGCDGGCPAGPRCPCPHIAEKRLAESALLCLRHRRRTGLLFTAEVRPRAGVLGPLSGLSGLRHLSPDSLHLSRPLVPPGQLGHVLLRQLDPGGRTGGRGVSGAFSHSSEPVEEHDFLTAERGCRRAASAGPCSGAPMAGGRLRPHRSDSAGCPAAGGERGISRCGCPTCGGGIPGWPGPLLAWSKAHARSVPHRPGRVLVSLPADSPAEILVPAPAGTLSGGLDDGRGAGSAPLPEAEAYWGCCSRSWP